MNTTVSAGDTRAPQNVTNVIMKTEMKAGVMNTSRSRRPPLYAKSDVESALGVSRYPERSDNGLLANDFELFTAGPDI
jgi:hypothetical protein